MDDNSRDLAAALASALNRTPAQVYELWSSHVKMFVGYALATAKHNAAGRTNAMDGLTGYAKSFAALIHDALPALSESTLQSGLKMHVATLKQVIDFQATKNFQKAGLALHDAYKHMDGLARGIAGALGLAGSADREGAELHSTLTRSLGEHVFAMSWATSAALSGRSGEFGATAGGWLDQTSRDIGGTIAASLNKTPAQAYEFWTNHIGMFIAYTEAVAAKNKAAQTKSLDDLNGYAKSFSTLINNAIPALPVESVQGLIAEHVDSAKAVIDAQSRKDFRKEYKLLRVAYKHMDMIGGALSQAIAG
ncbi:MAG: hypothetical protein NVSMB57_14480 [Actinomycetota bacterium]